MKRLIVTGATGLIFFAVSALAQTAVETAPAPALIKTTEVSRTDSPLVRAAKQALAKRKKPHGTVIDDETVKHASGSRMTEPTQPLPPIPVPSDPITTPSMRVGAPEAPQGPDRATLEKRLETLKKQQARLSAEGEEPYGGDVDPDAVAKQLSNVTEEMKKLEKQLAALPKKP
ncbi:MAG TPA: hypothetical protein VF219_03145 [Vicinamibacterales bacterium]